jgi:hypothetical protein
MSVLRSLFLVGSVVLSLAACGGGSDSPAPAPVPSPAPTPAPAPAPAPAPVGTAEGFWSGTASSGYNLLGAVLDNGDYWVMYYANNLLYGVVQGTGTSSNGNFTSSNGLDYFLGGGVTPVAVAASYRSKLSLQGTLTPQAGGSVVTFTSAYEPAYEVPATAAAVQGVWRGRLLSGETYTMNVSSNGSFTGAGSSGCTFTGSIVARPGGRAAYNLSATFNGGVCLLGNQTITGIGVIAGTPSTPQLYAAALNPSRSAGFVLISGR